MRCIEDVQEAAKSFETAHRDFVFGRVEGVSVDQITESSGQAHILISLETSQDTKVLKKRKSKYISR
jgi:hypothetical protein